MKLKIGFMENIEALDLLKQYVIEALIEGGEKLNKLRHLVKNWVEIQKDIEKSGLLHNSKEELER